jgi:hypothetical protein
MKKKRKYMKVSTVISKLTAFDKEGGLFSTVDFIFDT